jgi:GxxExxY protein
MKKGVDVVDKNDEFTEAIIACAYKVSNTLGCGFLEKVYENALAYELRNQGYSVSQQYPIHVRYDGVVVGDYVADLIVSDRVIIEIKAVNDLNQVHTAQALNYLKATGIHVALLFNFGKPKIEVRRFVNQF